MTSKKIIALALAAVMLTAATVGCGKEKGKADNDESLGYSSPTREELEEEIDFEKAEADGKLHKAEDGEILIEAEPVALAGPERITSHEALWADDNGQYADFTMPESVMLSNGSLGTLRIPDIGLEVGVYETDDELESMKHGIGHLKTTSAWSGNIGLTGHNRGQNTYFGRVHELKNGSIITLETALGTRTYAVQSSKVIDEYDWSMLGRTEDNRVTLITCIDNRPTVRLCVQAVEVVE